MPPAKPRTANNPVHDNGAHLGGAARRGAGNGRTNRSAMANWQAEPVGRVAAPLRDQVLDVVRQAILNFELPPGQRLVERNLVEQLAVSRATVREVLALLSSEGLVTVIPQKGAIVSVLTPAEAADIYEMRATLEALAVQRFVERANAQQVRDLRKALTAYEKSVRQGVGNAKSLSSKDAFYDVLLAGANSPPLAEMLTILQGRVRLLRATSLTVPGRSEEALAELTAVVEAIEAGEAKKAAQLSTKHVRNAARTGLTRLAEIENARN